MSTGVVPVTVLFRCSIAGLRIETEAASKTASTYLENAYIINHMSRVYNCACTSIKVSMVVMEVLMGEM